MRSLSLALAAVALAPAACAEQPLLPKVHSVGVIVVELASSGLDQPARNAVTVSLQGGPTKYFAGPTPIVFSNVAGGQHMLTLGGIGPNCSLHGEHPRTVTVAIGKPTQDTVRATFERSCVAVTGVIEATVKTIGDDRDPTGYALRIGASSRSGVWDGRNHVSGVAAGEHEVSLEGIAANCTAENGPQRVSVTTGGTTRDTARTAFQVTCVRVPHIAFTSRYDDYYYTSQYVIVAHTDGSEAWRVTPYTPGHSASWSPNGQRLVFVAQNDCDYERCKETGLDVVDINSGVISELTSEPLDGAPAWSPDGSKIAFVRAGELMVINADGSSERTLVARDAAAGRHTMGSPAWSPDGTRIAFTCVTNAGWSDICLASADGTGIVRLSNDASIDADPSWSPDGTRLALTTDRGTTDGTLGVAVMNADGSNLTRLADGREPVWSADGVRILFGFPGTATHGGGLFSVLPDGTDLTRVTWGSHDAPTWRP